MDSADATNGWQPVTSRTRKVVQKVRHWGHLATFITTEAIACVSPRCWARQAVIIDISAVHIMVMPQ